MKSGVGMGLCSFLSNLNKLVFLLKYVFMVICDDRPPDAPWARRYPGGLCPPFLRNSPPKKLNFEPHNSAVRGFQKTG